MNIDSEGINDLTSQELDKRINQMKAKIKDLQENEMKFGIDSQNLINSNEKKDYQGDDDSEAYHSPKDYKIKKNSDVKDYDEDSDNQYEDVANNKGNIIS